MSTRNIPHGLTARFFPAVLAAAVVGFGLYFDQAASSLAAQQQQGAAIDTALAREAASPEVRRIARWAVATQDAAGLPFVVVDKVQARIFAFDPQGHPTGNGALQTDRDLAPGRFVADPLASARSGAIVWANASAQLAARSLTGDAGASDNTSLQVEPGFWFERLAALRTQPSVAYVLPQGYTARGPS